MSATASSAQLHEGAAAMASTMKQATSSRKRARRNEARRWRHRYADASTSPITANARYPASRGKGSSGGGKKKCMARAPVTAAPRTICVDNRGPRCRNAAATRPRMSAGARATVLQGSRKTCTAAPSHTAATAHRSELIRASDRASRWCETPPRSPAARRAGSLGATVPCRRAAPSP